MGNATPGFAERFYDASNVILHPVVAAGMLSDATITIATNFGREPSGVHTLAVTSKVLRSIGGEPFDYFNHCGNFIWSGGLALAAISLLPEKQNNPSRTRMIVTGLSTAAVGNTLSEVVFPKIGNDSTGDVLDAGYGIVFSLIVSVLVARRRIQKREETRR